MGPYALIIICLATVASTGLIVWVGMRPYRNNRSDLRKAQKNLANLLEEKSEFAETEAKLVAFFNEHGLSQEPESLHREVLDQRLLMDTLTPSTTTQSNLAEEEEDSWSDIADELEKLRYDNSSRRWIIPKVIIQGSGDGAIIDSASEDARKSIKELTLFIENAGQVGDFNNPFASTILSALDDLDEATKVYVATKLLSGSFSKTETEDGQEASP